jgi:3-oxoacyl-[acyl-carrier protein] reductase
MQAEANDRIALVTGAGSPTGIAAARILGREGARLAICSTTERIHERSAELVTAGHDAHGFVADLTDRKQVRSLIDDVTQGFGRIDILVNNADMVSVGEPDTDGTDSFLSLTDEAWDGDIARNLDTAYNVTRAVVPGMVERGWGRVVMVSSVTGPLVTELGTVGYSAAKAAWTD